MAIEVIREGNQVPPRYFLKCALCHSVLRFTKNDAGAHQVLDNKDVAIYHYYRFLKCPLCGIENFLPYYEDEWLISEEELDK